MSTAAALSPGSSDGRACGYRAAAMDVNGWGYVECVLPAGHPPYDQPRKGHSFGPIVYDGGAERASRWEETR